MLKKFYFFLLLSLITVKTIAQTVVQNVTYTSGSYTYAGATSVTSPSISTDPVNFSGSAQVSYRSRSEISLNPGFSAGSFSNNGFFETQIDNARPSDCVYTYPYNESFEYDNGPFSVTLESSNAEWTRASGTIPHSTNGTKAADGNYYFYVNDYSPAGYNYGTYLQGCFEFNHLLNPWITFSYYGQGTPNMSYLAYSLDGTTIYPIIDLRTYNNSQWNTINIPLVDGFQNSLGGIHYVYLYFQVAGLYSGGDVAIDNITVYDAPAIVITSPTSSSSWAPLTPQTITWKTNIANDNVKIELLNPDYTWSTITASTPSTGTYTYTPTNSQGYLGEIRITSLSNPSVVTTSSLFTLQSPTITITSPTANTVWTSGETATVSWTSSGIPAGTSATINIIDQNGVSTPLETTTINAGNATVNVPDWTTPVNNAQINITLNNNNALSATSNPFTVSPPCSTTISTYPYSEGFESGYGIWSTNPTDQTGWIRQAGPSPVQYTGPSSGAHSGSYYQYINATAPNNPNHSITLTSSCFDLSAQNAPVLSFWYNMYGYGMGSFSLQVSTDRGGNWTTLWTMSGDQGDVWNQAIVNLSKYNTRIVELRFLGVTGSTYLSDMAIDDILIQNVTSCPSAINTFPYTESFESGLDSWVASGDGNWTIGSGPSTLPNTGPSAAEDGSNYVYVPSNVPLVNVKTDVLTSPCFNLISLDNPELDFWYNMYGSGIDELTVEVSTDGGNNWSLPIWSLSGNQGTGWYQAKVDISPYKQSNSFMLRFSGTTANESTANMAIDNISIIEANTCSGTAISSFPYAESFETNGLDGWSQSISDNKDWTLNSGTVPQSGTGPAVGGNGSYAEDGSNYLYINCSDQPLNRSGLFAMLLSPCFNLSSFQTSKISFWYNMYGANMGSLELDVSTTGGVTWNSIWTMSGNQGQSWLQATVDISSYIGSSVMFRFIGTTGDAYTSDMAIDNIQITGQNITITSPTSSTSWTSGTVQTVTWATTNVPSTDHIKIEFYDGSNWSTLNASASNTGSASVTLPTLSNAINNAQIRLTCVEIPAVTVTSSPFTINTNQSITITAPAGGSSYNAGSNLTVNWTSINIQPSATVSMLFYNGSSWSTLVSSTPNSGSATVTLPSIASTITNAQIMVELTSNNAVSATSNAFTVKVTPTITITSPTSSTVWTGGATQTVSWTTTNILSSSTIQIQYSSNGGSTWTTLNSGTPNTGSASITVPYTTSNVTNSMVKLILVSNTSITATSSAFTTNTSLCSGTTTLTASSGTFTDGSGPNNNYANNMNCTWDISIPAGYTFTFTITLTGLDGRADCPYPTTGDYIYLNGGTVMGDIWSCASSGTSGPNSVINDDNNAATVSFQFVSDGSVTAAGWSISYNITSNSPRLGVNLTPHASDTMTVSPNPSSEIFHVSLNYSTDNLGELLVINMLGEEVWRLDNVSLKETNLDISLKDYPSGVYILRLLVDGKAYSNKLLLSK